MSDDKIAEIRARHELVGSSGSVIHPTGFSWTIPGWVAHNDRATLLAEDERHRAQIERLRVKHERLRERLLQERAALVLDEIGAALERERVLRAALTDMLSGWRYIRDTYGDLAGVGWDRVEQKAREALEGKP